MRGPSQTGLAVSMCLVLALAGTSTAKSQGAEVIVVDTTSDVVDCHNRCVDCECWESFCELADLPGPDGLISLREAICVADYTAGPQVVEFNIPTTDSGYDGQTFTVRPRWGLALVHDGTTLDGTTQPTMSNPFGPEIVLEGSALHDPGQGLGIFGSNNVVRGFVIHSFSGGAGIQFIGQPSGNTISDCYIGVDATGTVAMPNLLEGIAIHGQGHVIRNNLVSANGPTFPHFKEILGTNLTGSLIEGNLIGTDRTGTVALGAPTIAGIGFSDHHSGNVIRGNLISGLGDFGIVFGGTGGVPNIVEDNRIGTDISGENPLGQMGFGIAVNGSDAGPAIIQRNVVAYNTGDGIFIDGATGVAILENSIFSNAELGIDLWAPDDVDDGVTANDPGDVDTGSNQLQNFPVLESAKATPGKLIVKGTIDTPDPKSIRLEFYAAGPDDDAVGPGEGMKFLGWRSPNPRGKFTAVLDPVEPGTVITATATDGSGNTSEFSTNIVAVAPGG